jgi:hypothetical protein
MTQWACELMLALRAADWPEPINQLPRYHGYAQHEGVIDIGPFFVLVGDAMDKVSISGPPHAVAKCLEYWRFIST